MAKSQSLVSVCYAVFQSLLKKRDWLARTATDRCEADERRGMNPPDDFINTAPRIDGIFVVTRARVARSAGAASMRHAARLRPSCAQANDRPRQRPVGRNQHELMEQHRPDAPPARAQLSRVRSALQPRGRDEPPAALLGRVFAPAIRLGARFRSRFPLQSGHRGCGSYAGDASSPWCRWARGSSQSHSR